MKQYQDGSVQHYQQSYNVVSQGLGRQLTLQEKIDLKKLSLLKQKGQKKEFKALLDQSSFANSPVQITSNIESPQKSSKINDTFASPTFVQDSPNNNSISQKHLADNSTKIDNTGVFGRTVRDFEHKELDDTEPDYMFKILFDASMYNIRDLNEFDFQDAIFTEKAGDAFEKFDDFKAHQIKKIQV